MCSHTTRISTVLSPRNGDDALNQETQTHQQILRRDGLPLLPSSAVGVSSKFGLQLGCEPLQRFLLNFGQNMALGMVLKKTDEGYCRYKRTVLRKKGRDSHAQAQNGIRITDLSEHSEGMAHMFAGFF